MAFSAHDEDDGLSDPDQQLAPPVRHNIAQGRLDKITGAKKPRKLPSNSDLAKREKQGRKVRNVHKYERQKELLDARAIRAFKELDTTLQVLGIDGGATDSSSLRNVSSPCAPAMHTSAAKAGSVSSKASLEAGISTRLSIDSGGSRLKMHSLSSIEQKRSSSPLTVLSRVSSRADSLEDERQRWHQGLDDLLQGNLNHDDLQVALSLAEGKAKDLREQLIYLQTPPEATWPAREERIEWLNQAMAQFRDVTIGLQQHGIDIKDSCHMQLYMQILKEVMVEMGNFTEMCCDAIAEGLLQLKDSPQDLHMAYRAACRIIATVSKPANAKRRFHEMDPGAGWNHFLQRAGGMCAKVVVAMMDATADFQTALLKSSSLTVSLGREFSAHEVSARSKQLQFAWAHCAEMAGLVSKLWPDEAHTVNCAWCSLMLGAAALANQMQQDLLGTQASNHMKATSSGLSDDSLATYAHTGVWCTSSSPKETASAACDEELQAQGWLPACLTRLLSNAENAATAALGYDEGLENPKLSGHKDSGEDLKLRQGLVEALSNSLYELAVTGNHRIGNMCLSPSGLACWALELLEEQACQAVVFVRDLDRSLLGRGEHGLVHYELLRKATDELVNSIFRVRRLLKQKRAADTEDALPRPLPGIMRSDSQSSLTAALQLQQRLQPQSAAQRADAPLPPSSQGSGRPPLANAQASTRGEGGSAARRIPSARLPPDGRPSRDGEHSAHSGRRHKLRHRHGTATPPIPEESDGEAGHSRPFDEPVADGLAYRDERGQHTRRHRHRKHRQRRTLSRDRCQDRPKSGDRTEQYGRAAELAVDPEIQDPFALPEFQDLSLQEQPSSALPLAVFSSALSSSNSLMPEGSRKLIKFGSFSTSPSQGNGFPSPRGTPTTPHEVSPFAGFQAPNGRLQSGFATSSEKESSEGSELLGIGNKPSANLTTLPTRELAGAALLAKHSSRETASDTFSHPMSDPTNGYHHLYNLPSLARVSGEPLRREGSSDSSGESASRDDTPPNGRSSGAEEVPETGGVAEEAVAFKLPWEGDPFWQISWEDLKPTIVRKIGSGSFGQVFEVYYHSAPMAMKIINIDGDATALPGTLLRFKQEVDLQRKLNHFPYIVRFMGACCHIPDAPPGSDSAYTTSNVTLAIVMELCRLGTLFKLIEWARKVSKLPPEVLSGAVPPRTQDEKRLKASPGFRLYNSWQLRLELAKHAAAAVEFMHANNIIHRDLTSYNLLVTDKFEAKVADFNLSRAMKGEMIPSSGMINSPEWAAPERLTCQKTYNGKAADVFSFGVILWELVTLEWPWHEPDGEFVGSSGADVPDSARGANTVPEPECVQQPRVAFYAVFGSVPKGERLKFPSSEETQPPLPQLPQLIELAEDCWKQEAAERPTMTEVCARLDSILDGIKHDSRERRAALRGP